MLWTGPPCSPDLNPIEHIWDIMSCSIHQRHVAPQTVQELADALVQVWEEIPQETIRHLIRSMPKNHLLNLHCLRISYDNIRKKQIAAWIICIVPHQVFLQISSGS
ncbi:hypothetical protein L3Q82_000209 [Scortum barcoo]|uniref:Uncharacterized protein n=1 Tax=Scortum barcoo TaxID=214431 RepID=A0ACB8XA83_9TELE|nr:hypothetical protein L3Q82_000209 [Scortum barcoo]